MPIRLFPFIAFCLLVSSTWAQTSYERYQIHGKRSHAYDPHTAAPDFEVELIHLEAPTPDGDSYKAFLMKQKIESRKRFPLTDVATPTPKKKTNAQPVVGEGFPMTLRLPLGNVIDYSGGIPNDNTLAVSNGGLLLAAVNSVIWGYDINNDTTILPTNSTVSLYSIGQGAPGDHFYDPKLIYDENADRFILVFLKNNVPASSEIIVCFSKTNNPADEWYVYRLPGNPLNNNRWTDFPSINITNDELFITGNLIIPGVSWQVGFDGSVIWQVNKNAGYNNDSTLPSTLYAQIKHEGKYTRNLHTVRGIGSSTSAQYFLSNRNFDVTNDSIFVMKIDGTMDDPDTELKITVGKTTPNYGVPPNGRQQDTDLNDPTKGLQTNDARVLGAITNDDWIQFVSTTVNPATGLAAVYHGFINNPTEEDQTISGNILGDNTLDLGYPNIAFTGNEFCDTEAMIGVNFTSPTDFPGVGAFYYGNDSSYSNFVRIREGENYTDRHSDSYERWGDYFGIQPKFDEPGKVWTAGYFGLLNNRNGTWINELKSPDSNQIAVVALETDGSVFCKGGLELKASGGIPPYMYSFNDGESGEDNIFRNICDGDTITYTVIDSRGCEHSDTIITKSLIATNAAGVYPNPFSTDMVVQFQLESDQQVEAYIYDLKGSMVARLLDRPGKQGKNELHFNLSPLRAGSYVLKVYANEKELLSRKLVKAE